MLEVYQLEQLLAVAEYGTLSKAAIALHLSQPALSRSMKKMEEELQVELFDRQKNKILLNDNGLLAVECAKKVMTQLEDMVNKVHAFERSQRTISIGSCAPAPLWSALPLLSSMYPGMTIASELQNSDKLMKGLDDGIYHIIIMPYVIDIPGTVCHKYGEEHLYFSLPPAHPLSGAKELRFEDLDGETMLLYSQIGFWHEMHLKKMPATHFLLQGERYAFDELVRASALPSFTSDIVLRREGTPPNRIVIPITDEEANVTFYCVCRKKDQQRLETFFFEVKNRTGSK